jgi:hypothetical protein
MLWPVCVGSQNAITETTQERAAGRLPENGEAREAGPQMSFRLGLSGDALAIQNGQTGRAVPWLMRWKQALSDADEAARPTDHAAGPPEGIRGAFGVSRFCFCSPKGGISLNARGLGQRPISAKPNAERAAQSD